MNEYLKLQKKQDEEQSKIKKFYAFSDKQFKEGLEKLNTDENNILSIGWGGFIKKSDKENYLNILEKQNKELLEKLKDEKYLYDGFLYELGNHEFCYTYEYEETLDCFGLKFEELTKQQLRILKKAKNEYLKNCGEC